jgi:hypothetical protein
MSGNALRLFLERFQIEAAAGSLVQAMQDHLEEPPSSATAGRSAEAA